LTQTLDATSVKGRGPGFSRLLADALLGPVTPQRATPNPYVGRIRQLAPQAVRVRFRVSSVGRKRFGARKCPRGRGDCRTYMRGAPSDDQGAVARGELLTAARIPATEKAGL
jgi:hypothetical protein